MIKKVIMQTMHCTSQVAVANKTAPISDYTNVVEFFEKIIKTDPKFLEAYLMLAKLYREIDRNKEYELLIKANDEFPDHYLIMFDLANMMCFRTGEKEKGLELLVNVFKNYQWLIQLGQD